jgi:hypothetical protein
LGHSPFRIIHADIGFAFLIGTLIPVHVKSLIGKSENNFYCFMVKTYSSDETFGGGPAKDSSGKPEVGAGCPWADL